MGAALSSDTKVTGASRRCRTRGARTPKRLHTRLVPRAETQPGRAWPGARVCAGSRPPLQANGGGRPQPLRRAAASLSVSSPSGAWARRPGPHSPRRRDVRHRRGVSSRQSKPPPRPPHDHPGPRAKTPAAPPPQPRHPGSPRISRRRAARCRARTRAPNKERRGTRPLHTRPPHFRRAGVSKFFPWPRPRDPQPRSSPPPLQRGAKFRGLAA